MVDAETGGKLVALIFLIKTWIYFNFFEVEVCHNRNQALAPSVCVEILALGSVPARGRLRCPGGPGLRRGQGFQHRPRGRA